MNGILKYEDQNLCEILEMTNLNDIFLRMTFKNDIVHKSYYSRILRMKTAVP